ncbi:hypothetical protein R0J91_20420, partial [Micrococcus sp. SIMBA_131]
ATKIKADERKKASLTNAYKMIPKTLFTAKLKTNNSVMDKAQIKVDLCSAWLNWIGNRVGDSCFRKKLISTVGIVILNL